MVLSASRPRLPMAAAALAAATAGATRLHFGKEEDLFHRPRQPHRLSVGGALCEASKHQLDEFSDTLLNPMIHYAETHGLVYAVNEPQNDASLATQCPVSMLPFMIPAAAFHEVVAMSPLWNNLVDAVARDQKWLHATLQSAYRVDPFTNRLGRISKAIHAEGLRQPNMLGIHRSDYMLHEPNNSSTPRFLQVELNTIASSMGTHAANVTKLHRYLLDRYSCGSDSVARGLCHHFNAATPKEMVNRLPENKTLQWIPAAMAEAYKTYPGAGSTTVVLIVTTQNEGNFADQRFLEHVLWEEHGITSVRKTLAEIHAEAKMDAKGRLCLANGNEVAVAYFRAGYSPDDYPTEQEWEARELLERSLAIKCPSIDYQLVGTKKVQQALAQAGAVERFLGAADAAKLRRCFAGLWGLGPGAEEDVGAVKQALQTPELCVLKPQREGGGNNYYGKDVIDKLEQLSHEEQGAYILMERILPRTQQCVLTRRGKAAVGPGLSEFGFYSVYLGDGQTTRLSEHAGHLVRTKGEGVDEGGVAAGYAVISSPYLMS